MREQRTPTSLRRVESVPERGAERSLVCEVGDEIRIPESFVKKLIYRMRQRYRVLLRHEVRQTVADPAEVDENYGTSVAHSRRAPPTQRKPFCCY